MIYIALWKIKNFGEGGVKMKYGCVFCGYVYRPSKGDPENGIEAGTDFEDLPEEWLCPLCGATKEEFEPMPEEDY